MNRVRSFCRGLHLTLLAMACWAALGGTALAEGDKGGPTSWTFPYALVMLFIGLGLLMVLNPTRRRQREKPEQYVGKKTLIDED